MNHLNLKLVGIEEYKNNYPQMLSGGIRQRVNIARAFIYPSKIIIMDEPFKSIDVKNKKIIMDSLKEILNKESRTVLFVTHDIDEAIYLADYIFVLGNSPVQVTQIFKNNKYLTKKELYEVIVLFVTHDIDEAIYLADYIFVLGNSPVQVTQIFKNNKYLTKKELYEVI